MEQTIMELIRELLKMDTKKLEAHLDDNQVWDSLTWLEAVFSIEEELQIKFEESEFPQIKTPRELCTAAVKKASSNEL